MASFNPANYVEVKDRIAEFYADHPAGTIRTYMAKMDGKEVIFEARVYRTPEEAERGIYTSGWAREMEGASPVNKTSHVENCETSAIGRALANLDYCGSVKGGKAPRPSREEMQKTQRPAAPVETGEVASGRQIAFLRNLLNSHVFTDIERAGIEKKIAAGLTKATATDIIDRTRATMDERKEIERQEQEGAA